MGESKSGLGHLQAWFVVLRLLIVRYTDGGGGVFRGVSAWFLAQSAQKVLEVPTMGDP